MDIKTETLSTDEANVLLAELGKDFRIGDIVTAYHKGFHILDSVYTSSYRSYDDTIHNTIQVNYHSILSSSYTNNGLKKYTCNVDFLTKANKNTIIKQLEDNIVAVKKMFGDIV